MSATHIALLRGVNMGASKRVPMAELRKLLSGLGYLEVQTLLNSGNALFRAAPGGAGSPAGRIEEAIIRRFGFTSRVTVLKRAELARIVEENPLGTVADNPSRLLVSVLTRPADRVKLVPLTRTDWAPEVLGLGSRAAYIWCSSGIADSRLAKGVAQVLGEEVTSRNWATILKLHQLASA